MGNKRSIKRAKQNAQDTRITDAARETIRDSEKHVPIRDEPVAKLIQNDTDEFTHIHETASESTENLLHDGANIGSKTVSRSSEKPPIPRDKPESAAQDLEQKTESITDQNAVLSEAFQTTSRLLLKYCQKQFERNLEALTKIAQAKSLNEAATIQQQLMREGMQHLVDDSKAITDAAAKSLT
jgi:hypothetical protein